ncbi:MAG: MobV family relaxase [Candidatus Paceibacteria bacterium]
MAFEFAWNAQKNQMSDVKGKEREQEREGKIKNERIDPTRTHLNYDFVKSEVGLYERTKERRDELKKEGSRVQKNSVVLYSNIITIPKEEADKMTDKEHEKYFKSCYEYFCDRYGKENVMSAKVHLDETTPHMHLHFMPVNKENGKLQARTVMGPRALREIHDQLPRYLQQRGFDVVRASGEKTMEKLNIHEYKAREDMKQEVQALKQQVDDLDLEYSITRAEVRTQKMIATDEVSKVKKQSSEQIMAVRKETDQKIAMIQEEVSKFEYDINLHREHLILDTDDVKTQLESTKRDLDHYGKQLFERIDSLKELNFDERIDLDLKPNLLKKVTMASETFDELKKRAESAEKMQRALRASEKENKSLKESNQSKDKELNELRGLRIENRKLQREVEFFKQVIEKIKVFMATLVQHKYRLSPNQMEQVVGYAKFQAKDRLGRNQNVDLQNESEKKGFDKAKGDFEEQRKELRKDSLDMGR